MEVRSISLRNFRVFENLDLEVPPGLVGIYGPNGAGKSSLLEAITWALYGRARTPKHGIATSGTTGECVVELGLDHDEHHYVIRRTISGMNHTVKARVTTAGQVVADGPTEVGRYVRALLGMDENSFRSSVFAEQKQLAAFSDHTADQRRRLVLSLLGITPIEKARDDARADARIAENDYRRLVGSLPDTDEMEARKAEIDIIALAQTAEAVRAAAVLDAANAERRLLADALRASEDARRRDELIRNSGLAARRERDAAQSRIAELEVEHAEIVAATEALPALEEQLRRFDPVATEHRIRVLGDLAVARRRLAALAAALGSDPLTAPPDPSTLRGAESVAVLCGVEVAEARATHDAALRELASARARGVASASLRNQVSCPTCGQELAGGSHAVIAHFEAEVDAAADRESWARTSLAERQKVSSQAEAAVTSARGEFTAAEVVWENSRSHRAALSAAIELVEHAEVAVAGTVGGAVKASDDLPAIIDELRVRVRSAAAAREERDRLIGRRQRLDRLTTERTDAQGRLVVADDRRIQLKAELDAVAFDMAEHRALAERLEAVERVADEALRLSREREAAVTATTREQTMLAARLDQIGEQRLRLGELSIRAVLLGRTAELLSGFRAAVVATVGPRLSTQASELFQSLTGGDYDGLQVDPETYEIQIIDQGVPHPTSRFSGSEVDLANLALRVAISEQVRFQAGGQVGLLVLDEALGSLDGDRKDRMLTALTQLSGRFRQILVVTHAVEVKEQLPEAIEIVKIGRRRSTARIVGGTW